MVIIIYKDIWNPLVGEVLQCKRDPHNAADRYSIAVRSQQSEKYQDCTCSSYGGGGGGGYNRLHGNWSEKTLCRSTPRQPGSSLFLACCFKKLFSLFCKYFVAENFVCLISYASSSPYENILTTKISQFMVHITYT